MKIREKKYLFEGFLNVFFITLVGLLVGFIMGTVGGASYSAQKLIELCLTHDSVRQQYCPEMKFPSNNYEPVSF